jgi:hypothetical protein
MATSLIDTLDTPVSSTNSLIQTLEGSQEAAQPKTSSHPVTDEVGNIFGNLAKHAAVGVGKLADLPGQVWDLAFHPSGDEDNADIATAVTKKAVGPTKNEGPVGRVIGAGIEAGPSAVLAGPEAALPSLLPTMASGAASQTAKELGAGTTGQFLAGITPLAAPTALAAGVRGIVRQGEAGRQAMQTALEDAKNAGVNISAGQAADNAFVRGAETVTSKLPFGKATANTRGPGLNAQVEESVDNIVKKLAPNTSQNKVTATGAGQNIQDNVERQLHAMGNETQAAKQAMEDAVGGKHIPMAAPQFEDTINKVTGPTGLQSVDNLVTKAKTKAVAKAANAVTQEPKIPTSYNTDGEGYHFISSPNGETHAIEDSQGNLKVTRSDTAEQARGTGEGTARLETAAQIAAARGKNLVSDVSVSPAEAAAYEKLGRKGWQVQRNPNAQVNPSTGNLISDSPKNPVYTVTAPKSSVTGVAPSQGQESSFTGEWTYDPKTGKTEPVTQPKQSQYNAQFSPELNKPTPWTFDSLRQMRTEIGHGIRSVRDPSQKGQLKQLYGAISEDLKAGVQQAGGESARQAFDLFNNIAKSNAKTQKFLTDAITKAGGPEQVFLAATNGTKAGASKVAPVFNALDDEGKNLFRATVLHRLGRQGGAPDAPFDANRFMTQWQQLSPEAKNLLFNTKTGWGAPGSLRTSLDSLANTLANLHKQGYIKSGLGKEASSIQHTMLTGVFALLAERAAEAGAHMMAGNHLAAAGGLAATAAAVSLNPVMSKVLTNPKTVGWLAQATKAPKAMLPVLINQLNNMKDPDAKDLAQLISENR